MSINNDSAANYSYHVFAGTGSGAISAGYANLSNGYGGSFLPYSAAANNFSLGVFDFYDYASTSKNKTIRVLGGFDTGSAGEVSLASNSWYNAASPISNLTFTVSSSGTYAPYSSFALYGIKE